MAPFGPWAGLHTELLVSIGDVSSLKGYSCLRGACSAWRSALAPPFPSVLILADGRASALLLPMQRSFHLSTLHKGSRFIGSSNGCLAVASDRRGIGIVLLNPLTNVEIALLPLRNDGKPVPKVVFAPYPRPDDYTAVAICDFHKLAYTKTRDMKWMILDVAMDRDQLTDLAYDTEGGKVYCLTGCGDVHVLHIPRGRRRKPIVEPLLAERAGLPFDPAAVFASPYNTASKLTGAKNLFFCNGSMYQVWRNTTGTTIAWMLPGGSRFSMSKDHIFVLRYDPERRPCWDAVKDLGGYSVFIGKNNPAVVRGVGVPGVRANCVYWIDERCRGVPMVFDMATGTSTTCVLPSASNVQSQHFQWMRQTAAAIRLHPWPAGLLQPHRTEPLQHSPDAIKRHARDCRCIGSQRLACGGADALSSTPVVRLPPRPRMRICSPSWTFLPEWRSGQVSSGPSRCARQGGVFTRLQVIDQDATEPKEKVLACLSGFSRLYYTANIGKARSLCGFWSYNSCRQLTLHAAKNIVTWIHGLSRGINIVTASSIWRRPGLGPTSARSSSRASPTTSL